MKLLGLIFVSLLAFTYGEQCWKSCLADETILTNRRLKHRLTDAAEEIGRLVDKYDIDGINFLFDNTLRQSKHDPMVVANLTEDENGDNIIAFQRDFTFALAHMSTRSTPIPYYLTKFNSRRGLSCPGFTCLDACHLGPALGQMEAEYSLDSDQEGKVEHACRIAHYYMTEADSGTCGPISPESSMAIVVANSGFEVERPKSSEENLSNCQQFFATRMSLGTHAADSDELDDFQSGDPWYYEFRDDGESMGQLSALRSCISEACCSGSESLGDLSSCKMTNYLEDHAVSVVAENYL